MTNRPDTSPGDPFDCCLPRHATPRHPCPLRLQAQRQLALLPPELQQRCISPALSAEGDRARMVQPIRVS